jgi:hypothetical protein
MAWNVALKEKVERLTEGAVRRLLERQPQIVVRGGQRFEKSPVRLMMTYE